jgi:hypothetical protein
MAYPKRRLDFDEWRELACADPEAFEAMRRRVLQAVIEQAPERCRRRLRGLQWQVDQVRRRSASPLDACISLSDMMWEAFAGERGLVQTLRGNQRCMAMGVGGQNAGPAKVIPLGKRRGGKD